MEPQLVDLDVSLKNLLPLGEKEPNTLAAFLQGGSTPDPRPSLDNWQFQIGFIDLIRPDRIAGWAQNIDHPEAPVCLDIYASGRLIGRAAQRCAPP